MSLEEDNQALRAALTEIQQIATEALTQPPPAAGMMLGQTRYLDYEVSPGCADCQNVFPQGCDLLRIHDSQCAFFQIATEPGVYNWTTLDKHLDSLRAARHSGALHVCLHARVGHPAGLRSRVG